MKTSINQGWIHAALIVCSCVAAVSSTGCQISAGGQTLPSPYYLKDDIQYFPKGPEFPLSNEHAAMTQYQNEQKALGN